MKIRIAAARQSLTIIWQAAIFAWATGTLGPAATAQGACRTYVGNVGGVPAQACIAINGDRVSGSYFYFRYQTPIELAGSLDSPTGALQLTERQRGGAQSGKWSVAIDDATGVISGIFSAGGASRPLFFYDASREPLRVQRHEEKFYRPCDDEGITMETQTKWDEIVAMANPDVADSVRRLLPTSLTVPREHSNELASPPTCKRDPALGVGIYKDYTSFEVSTLGRLLVAVESSSGGYTGGAHGFEGAKLKYYDLRTGKEVPFLDFFTKRGQNLLMERVKADIAKERDGVVPPSCKIDLSQVWELDQTSASPDDLRFWNISYGTYAFGFGCTGRIGYEMEGLPDEVVAHELNPLYFDPKTKFFYK